MNDISNSRPGLVAAVGLLVVLLLFALALEARRASHASSGGGAKGSASSMRVASVSLTGDAIVAHWLEPPQLAAVSELVDWPDYWLGRSMPKSIPRLTGAVEPVAALRPDLTVVADFATPGLASSLRAIGIATHELRLPQSIDGVLSEVVRLGERLGLNNEARRWCADLSRRIAAVRERGAVRPHWRALVLESNYAYGRGTLADDVLEHLGATNVLSERGLNGLVALDAEQMVAFRPDLVFVAVPGSFSVRDARAALAMVAGYDSLTGSTPNVPRWVFGIPRAQLSTLSPAIVDALESMDRAISQWTR